MRAHIPAETLRWHSGRDRFDPRLAIVVGWPFLAILSMGELFGARKLRVALDELPAVKVWDLRAAGLIGRGHGAS